MKTNADVIGQGFGRDTGIKVETLIYSGSQMTHLRHYCPRDNTDNLKF